MDIIIIQLHRTVSLTNTKHIFVYTYILTLPYTLLFSFVISSSSSLTCIMAVRKFEPIEIYSESTYNKMLEIMFMVSYVQCLNTKILVRIHHYRFHRIYEHETQDLVTTIRIEFTCCFVTSNNNNTCCYVHTDLCLSQSITYI